MAERPIKSLQQIKADAKNPRARKIRESDQEYELRMQSLDRKHK